jgi:hypothetical protein
MSAKKKVKLPPDPEEMNDERADWAEAALGAFQEETGTDDGDAIGDLLSNLMHWCDRNNADFAAEVRRGYFHYYEETSGMGPQHFNNPGVPAMPPDLEQQGEDPKHTREDWAEEVRQHNTQLGYWEWLWHMILMDENETQETTKENK